MNKTHYEYAIKYILKTCPDFLDLCAYLKKEVNQSFDNYEKIIAAYIHNNDENIKNFIEGNLDGYTTIGKGDLEQYMVDSILHYSLLSIKKRIYNITPNLFSKLKSVELNNLKGQHLISPMMEIYIKFPNGVKYHINSIDVWVDGVYVFSNQIEDDKILFKLIMVLNPHENTFNIDHIVASSLNFIINKNELLHKQLYEHVDDIYVSNLSESLKDIVKIIINILLYLVCDNAVIKHFKSPLIGLNKLQIQKFKKSNKTCLSYYLIGEDINTIIPNNKPSLSFCGNNETEYKKRIEHYVGSHWKVQHFGKDNLNEKIILVDEYKRGIPASELLNTMM